MGVVVDVQLERSHSGLEEAFAGAGKALVVDIHPLELGLAGRLFDEPDQAPLDRWIARGRIAEEIFVHANRLRVGAAIYRSRDHKVTKPPSGALGVTLGEPVEILQFRHQRLEILERHHIGAI